MSIVGYFVRKMGTMVWLGATALVVVSFFKAAHGQTSIFPTAIASTPIVKFDNVAGKWVGHANSHNVSLEIDATGRFTARYAFGGVRGEARLENGALVIPLTEHHGLLQLAWNGETLKGPGQIAGKTWMVSLVRNATAAKD